MFPAKESVGKQKRVPPVWCWSRTWGGQLGEELWMAGASLHRSWFVRKENCCVFSSSAPCWQPFLTLSLGTTFVFSVMCLGLSCGSCSELLNTDFSPSHSLPVLVSAACEGERGAVLHDNGAQSLCVKSGGIQKLVRNYLKRSLNTPLAVKLESFWIETYADLLLHVCLARVRWSSSSCEPVTSVLPTHPRGSMASCLCSQPLRGVEGKTINLFVIRLFFA